MKRWTSSWNSCVLQGCIFEGKESPQFIALFHPMVVLKVPTCYYAFSFGRSRKEKLHCVLFVICQIQLFLLNRVESSLCYRTYSPGGIALIQISGTSAHNSKGMQVDAVWMVTFCFLFLFFSFCYLESSSVLNEIGESTTRALTNRVAWHLSSSFFLLRKKHNYI